VAAIALDGLLAIGAGKRQSRADKDWEKQAKSVFRSLFFTSGPSLLSRADYRIPGGKVATVIFRRVAKK
jgi:hypothetical protein